MRKPLFLALGLVSYLLCCLPLSFGEEGNNKVKESQLIRRVYLDVLNVPPSIKELEWYEVYNTNGYVLAVEYVLNNKSNVLIPSFKKILKEFLLSQEYKLKEFTPLSLEQRDIIIKYQSGIWTSEEEANKKLVLDAIISNEPGVMDPIDYLAECLMGRDTSAEEATLLNKILKRYPSEEEGYLMVLEELKTFKDFYTK